MSALRQDHTSEFHLVLVHRGGRWVTFDWKTSHEEAARLAARLRLEGSVVQVVRRTRRAPE